ncbi:MAG: flagellar export chaperone FliS [Idiomarina sp.]|uniref:flagellar export chaperone FliS n=1 Tax=Idiomarina sp. TaxID=1874361 RepID=UPI000C6A7454|nr:flagellar export chaperone FliS [Idiomarina sp.]MBT42783.1 flagellar export chaperone FliS [Idiomarina sp.]
MKKGLNAYKQVGIKDQIATADPHRIIQMLMQGALDRMAQAKGAIERKDFADKSQHISKAMAIVHALRDSVKPVDGAEEVSGNLVSLYEFITEQLQQANADNQTQPLVDASSVLATIKEGWDSIPAEEKEKVFGASQSDNVQMTASAGAY